MSKLTRQQTIKVAELTSNRAFEYVNKQSEHDLYFSLDLDRSKITFNPFYIDDEDWFDVPFSVYRYLLNEGFEIETIYQK